MHVDHTHACQVSRMQLAGDSSYFTTNKSGTIEKTKISGIATGMGHSIISNALGVCGSQHIGLHLLLFNCY